jgi:plasmid stabilization system protein ParE
MSRRRFVLTPEARAGLIEIWNWETTPIQIIAVVHGAQQLEASSSSGFSDELRKKRKSPAGLFF